MMLLSPTSFAAGVAAWSFAEYAIHRFAGHAPPKKKADRRKLPLLGDSFGGEHLAHHRDTTYFSPTRWKLLTAVGVVGVTGTVGTLLLGPRRGIGFALGFGLMYGGYEIAHRRTHTHAPRGPYSRWTRRNHLYHHLGDPRMNHGVTSPVWDHLFGTHEKPGRIRVPLRHAPAWLLDGDGKVRDEYRADYELATPAQAQASQPTA